MNDYIKDVAISIIVLIPFFLIVAYKYYQTGFKSGYIEAYQSRINYEHGK